jgi:hypothetical protein
MIKPHRLFRTRVNNYLSLAIGALPPGLEIYFGEKQVVAMGLPTIEFGLGVIFH